MEHEDLTPFASVVIIRTDQEEPNFVLEEKTPGYPAERLVGGICLIGGVGNASRHANFLDTIKAEVQEEFRLRPDIGNEVIRRLEYWRGFTSTSPGEYVSPPRRTNYTFKVAVFNCVFPGDIASELGIIGGSTLLIDEGKVGVYSEKDLETLPFVWGYDKIVERYIGERLGRTRMLQHKLPGVVIADADVDPRIPYRKMR